MFREGSSVAIDESHFLTTSEGVQIWVFGIVYIENEIQASYHAINDRTEENSLPLIQYYVETSEENKLQ